MSFTSSSAPVAARAGRSVRELAARGKRVRAVGRTAPAGLPAGVESGAADAADPDQVRRALAGATVAYHAVNVPYQDWAERLPPIMAALIDGAASTGTRLVYVDNLYMYGPVDGPITESLPNRATTRKGQLRARLADHLLAAHATGTVQATIGRAADFFGPGVLGSAVGERLFGALLAGKRAMWPGDLDVAHSLSFADDVARALITLGERPEAWGSVWHLPAPAPLTGRQFLELVFAEAGQPPRIGVHRSWQIRLAGLFDPMIREFAELDDQFTLPFVLDSRRYQQTFGGAPTPYRAAIRQTLAWYRRR